MEAFDVVAAVLQPGRGAPGAAPVVRFGTVVSAEDGVATVNVAGGTVAGVPCYCPGVVEDAQVMLVSLGSDLAIIGVRQ